MKSSNKNLLKPFLWSQVLNKRRPHVSKKSARVTYYSSSRVRDHRRSLFKGRTSAISRLKFRPKVTFSSHQTSGLLQRMILAFRNLYKLRTHQWKRLELSVWSTKKLHRVKETRLSRIVSALNSVSGFVSNSQMVRLQMPFSHCPLARSPAVWSSNWRWKFFRIAPSHCLVSWWNKCTNRCSFRCQFELS